MDAARTAKRLGADETLIVYRRDQAHMPARAFEVQEAVEEGVKIKWLTTIKEIVGPDLTVEMMELDANGRPQPTGRFETLKADAIVLAIGQETDSGFLRQVPGIEFAEEGIVKVGPDMMTGHPGDFCRRRYGSRRAVSHHLGRPWKTRSPPHRCLASWRAVSATEKAPTCDVQYASFAGL